MKNARKKGEGLWLLFVPVLLVLSMSSALAQGRWGQPGDPVHLKVGYQTYFTASWSGMVMRAKRFYERYLPAGSTVRWEIGLHGPVILNALREKREDLGYLGDMPALAAAARPNPVDLRIVAVTGFSRSLCNSLLVRTDAPAFADMDAALAWLNGKRVAASFGGCTDRFARQIFERGGIRPSDYINVTPTVLPRGFSGGFLDAAVVQEPVASQLVAAGHARRAVTGNDLDENDASFLVANNDLIRERPDVIVAWLEAELDAQLYMIDPKNADEIARIAVGQTVGYELPVMWNALYAGASGETRLSFPFVVAEPMHDMMARALRFLGDTGRLASNDLRPEAFHDAPARTVLERRGFVTPVGEVRALAPDAFRQQKP